MGCAPCQQKAAASAATAARRTVTASAPRRTWEVVAPNGDVSTHDSLLSARARAREVRGRVRTA